MSAIKELIEKIVAGKITVPILLCTVESVDKNNCTIDVKPVNGNADMFEVRLRSIIDDKDTGQVIFPAKDSHVLVGLIDNNVNSACVIQYSEIESIQTIIGTGNKTLYDKDAIKIDWKKVIFNGGNNKGLVKIMPLVGRINNLENNLNGLIAKYNVHTHDVVGAVPLGANPIVATPTATGQSSNTIAPLTTQAQLENTKITH